MSQKVSKVIVLFLLLALSCGIVSQFISELPQHYLFLSLLLKLISSPWHLIFFDLLCNDYFSESHPFYSLCFIVSVLLFINSSTCFCFAYSVQHFGRLQLF